jgi:prevent-host-death family protein
MTMEAQVEDAEVRISAAEFKTNCLRLMDEVARRRIPVVITKRGKPVAKLVPISEEPIDIFGRMAGTIRICGDIVGPTGEIWEADAENV